MSIWELIGYTRRRIKGKRAEILLVCLPPLASELLFRLGEAAFYSLLLYFGEISPAALFTGGNIGLAAAACAFTALRWSVTAPLICAAAVRLRDITGGSVCGGNASELLLRGSFVRRSIAAYAGARLLSFAALIPAALLGAYAYTLVYDGGGSDELFAASNAAALAAVSGAVWVAVRLSVTAVPFLLAEYPDRSALGCVFMSLRFMRGRKRLPLMLGAIYALPLASVVGIPLFLPELAAAFATGVSIFFKEDEYARAGARRAR